MNYITDTLAETINHAKKMADESSLPQTVFKSERINGDANVFSSVHFMHTWLLDSDTDKLLSVLPANYFLNW